MSEPQDSADSGLVGAEAPLPTEREPRISDDQANALATQQEWPTDASVTQTLLWLGADLLDARSRLAVQRAKVAMYERWMREHTPSCPLLAENIVLPPADLHRVDDLLCAECDRAMREHGEMAECRPPALGTSHYEGSERP